MTDRFGLLYDSCFDRDLVRGVDRPDFLEVIPDRYRAVEDLGELPGVLATIPTVFHSLDLSLGSDEALDQAYVAGLVRLAAHLKPRWLSDHLALTRVGRASLGCLMPVRWTAAAVERIAAKIAAVQDALGLPFLVENITYYVRVPGAELSEAELLHRLVERSGCGLLLDLNNLAVNAANHGFDPRAQLAELPLHAVHEIHVAGHRKRGTMWIDSHGDPVDDLVWDLLRLAGQQVGPVHVVLERDQDIPAYAELMGELATAQCCLAAGRAAGDGPRR
jgi:uncharacterized protein (UPF0276 family)